MLDTDVELGIITTISGVSVDVVHPTPDMFHIQDIAHSLSMQVRYTGHVKKFYSVAEHSFLVSSLCGEDPLIRLYGLLHDSSEFCLADLAAPIKHLPELATYRLLERRVWASICSKFNLPLNEPAIVRRMDKAIRVNEQHVLRGRPVGEGEVLLPAVLPCWDPKRACMMFLELFNELTSQISQEKPYA